MVKMDLQSPSKFLCIGFWREGSGMTRVMESIVNAFLSIGEVDLVGIGYNGEPSMIEGLTVYQANSEEGDGRGVYMAEELLRCHHYRKILVLPEIWHVKEYLATLRPVSRNTPIIAYIPIDGEIVNPQIVNGLEGLDICVLYHTYARKQIVEAFSQLGAEPPRIEVIPHGVDKETFQTEKCLSLSDRVEWKQEIFPDLKNAATAQIVLNANMATYRKHIEVTVEGFAQCVRETGKDIYLCLHHDPSLPDSVELNGLIKSLNIEDRILKPQFKHTLSSGHATDAELAKLYRACDIGINTSRAEGWGLVSFEHAACGSAQVVTNHGSCLALWDGVALLLDSSPKELTAYSSLAFRCSSVDSAAEQLTKLLEDQAYNEIVGQACYDYLIKCPDWSDVTKLWEELVLSC